MTQWYFSYGNNERIGPLDDEAARAQARSRPDGYCWKEGFGEWRPIHSVFQPANAMAVAPPPVPAGRYGASDEVDYRIVGSDMQFVEVELDPGESAIAEAGALMYKESAVQMDTVFGDGSTASQGGGLMGKLLSAGKRVITGESLFTTVFTHTGSGKARSPSPRPTPAR
jgi:hypothetical protein